MCCRWITVLSHPWTLLWCFRIITGGRSQVAVKLKLEANSVGPSAPVSLLVQSETGHDRGDGETDPCRRTLVLHYYCFEEEEANVSCYTQLRVSAMKTCMRWNNTTHTPGKHTSKRTHSHTSTQLNTRTHIYTSTHIQTQLHIYNTFKYINPKLDLQIL